MFTYYNDLEMLAIVYLALFLLFCAVASLVLYIREKRLEKKLEALHRRAVFERIKRERDEAVRMLRQHRNFERIQREMAEPEESVDGPSDVGLV